ncbi:hypothetical protein N0V93_002648 [Gnomoniopsis smithogilvyi]|uniref:SET domain-containing protein n=1 Tax=Gnomoniopsis smithogilvyi TaxID=1191159 RepID=A0A9W8YY02_9PEZI|nr:hypothetical protein N0V93_002648 [Gnomoniopsis smithogilvyi]
MYEVRVAGVKGLGVFAKQLIPRGTRIFSERALLTIPHGGDGASAGAVLQSLGPLTLLQRTALLGLSEGAPGLDVAILRWGQVAWYRTLEALGTLRPRFAARGRLSSKNGAGEAQIWKPSLGLRISEHVRILAIFRSNAFNIGMDRQALFPRIARINHSCIPNAQGNFHEGQGRLNIHATRDIPDGEEVMINYLKETGVTLRRQRQGKLLEGYGFDCDCAACDLTSKPGRDREVWRMEALSKLAKYAQNATESGVAHKDAECELDMMMAMVKLFEKQGLTGRGLSSYYLEASKLCVKLGRTDEALLCAEKALQIDEDCLGKDHDLYQNSLELVGKLREGSFIADCSRL